MEIMSNYIDNALDIANIAHKDQVWANDVPYIAHLIGVATMLFTRFEGVFNEDTLCACLLHDLFEDTTWTEPEIRGRVSDETIRLVNLLTDRPGKTEQSAMPELILSLPMIILLHASRCVTD